ncbi:myosin heavy chain, striated muscle [Sesbania bispinosa]|nr:myosin heavy chain, striated muscle [Sesbania bispinosa]
MTEDKDESKAQIPCSAKVVTSNTQEDKTEPRGVSLSEEIFKAEARGIMPKSYDDTGAYNNQKSTNFSDETTARFNVRDSTAGFSPNFYLNRGISRTSGGQFGTDPYYGTTLSLPADDQSLGTRYLENGSRFDSRMTPFDPFSNGGPSSSGRFMYPTFPINPSYQNATPQMTFGATPQMTFGDELSRPYSSRTIGVPHTHRFSFNGDHLR